MLAGKAPPAAGTPPGMPFAVHHHMLTQAGMHLIENAEARRDGARQGLALLHHRPAPAGKRRRRVRHPPGRYRSCRKMRTRPMTETSHAAVRR